MMRMPRHLFIPCLILSAWWLLVQYNETSKVLGHPIGQMELFGPFQDRETCMREVATVRLRRQIVGPITFNCVEPQGGGTR